MRASRAPLFAVPVIVAALVAGPAVTVRAQQTPVAPPEGLYYLQSATTGLNAAATGGRVAQHRPRGNSDHQQWWLHAGGDAYTLENTDSPGQCLGRTGDSPGLVACGGDGAGWDLAGAGPDRYALKDPGADRYLTVAPSGDTYADALALGPDGDLARWYLTPLVAPKSPLPPESLRTLDQVTFLTAHNAYANGVDGGFAPPIVNLFPNQNRGLDQQLAEGVRGFMLDIHQTPDGAILCHDSCTLVSRPVALWVDLRRIVEFLRQHRTEIVTVFLEDYVAPDVLRAELARVPDLAGLLLRPDVEGVRQRGWPTLGELRQRDKRLLIFTDHSRADDESAGLTRDSFGVMYQRDWTVENFWSMGPGVGGSDWSCYSRWYGGGVNIPLTRTEPGFRPLFVMNHFRDVPVPPTITTDNGKLADRAERFCEPAARKKPNFLAVDRYDLGDPGSAVDLLNTYRYAGMIARRAGSPG
ncbi:phospholipase [Planosporangium thailandense]|uniref:Phospholipase n=1 Tax=Planosporangium thailandense TaxID=765197 RepID=A0ABX0Y9E2_9ACTN|nr:RICIN domain-containing protein [Planosporangium thailandense]NJC74030.1 phospholipase [Planosporangium thailandense]